MLEAKPNNPEARRIALKERLSSFHQAVTETVVLDETQEAQITFARTLTAVQRPKTLGDLLFVIRPTSQSVRLEYVFSQRLNHPTQGNFSIRWETNEETGKAHGDSDDNIRTPSRSKRLPIDIKAISISVSEKWGWVVKFLTDDRESYVEFDERNHWLKSTNPQLFSSLAVAHEILTDKDRKLKLQEELVSLLDPTAPSVNLSVGIYESPSHRQKRQDERVEALISEQVRALRDLIS